MTSIQSSKPHFGAIFYGKPPQTKPDAVRFSLYNQREGKDRFYYCTGPTAQSQEIQEIVDQLETLKSRTPSHNPYFYSLPLKERLRPFRDQQDLENRLWPYAKRANPTDQLRDTFQEGGFPAVSDLLKNRKYKLSDADNREDSVIGRLRAHSPMIREIFNIKTSRDTTEWIRQVGLSDRQNGASARERAGDAFTPRGSQTTPDAAAQNAEARSQERDWTEVNHRRGRGRRNKAHSAL